MRPFLVCIHDATPAYARETRELLRGLAPLLGRRLSFGVVPDWHGVWPLTAHPGYCQLLRESSDELLLHGCFHRRQRGWGPVTWLTEGADEMNGLDAQETRHVLEHGQRVFAAAFGAPARGFVAPAWQRGRVGPNDGTLGLEHAFGFFALESRAGCRVRLATWTWDWGRWGRLGHIGHGVGSLSQAMNRGTPAIAIHPRDLERGFWPEILRLVRSLLDAGYEPTTMAEMLKA
jgi:hypothetical protein